MFISVIIRRIGLDALLAGLRAAGEATRLRLLHALGQSDLTVSELTQILGQSQPRISRHLKLMVEAGLLDRHREGAWVFYRLADRGPQGALVRGIAAQIPLDDPEIARDRARLAAVRAERQAAANAYFGAIAAQWDTIRSRHVPEAEVEGAVLDLLVGPDRQGRLRSIIDLGTGTARMLEILAPFADEALGIDQSADMLRIARSNLEALGARHLRVRQGDIYHLPVDSGHADAVILNQVLHFLDNPARAVDEAARLLAPGGTLVIGDFAPHELEVLRTDHAHRRLGFSDDEVRDWCCAAGLDVGPVRHLTGSEDMLTVTLWQARRVADQRIPT
jgi:ArsR family transcriptional regulator